ncbi:MAG: hypothetical protein ABI626_04565 [Sphingomicrobium sp.]
MRSFLMVVPLLLAASPALAQPVSPATRPAPIAPPETIVVPPQLTDPATVDRIGGMMQAMSKALLNLPVGEIEAAAQGRPATRADRARTIRDIGRATDPDFERNLDRQLADSRIAVQAGIKAVAAALPAVIKDLTDAGHEIEKATANLPSPNYPKR